MSSSFNDPVSAGYHTVSLDAHKLQEQLSGYIMPGTFYGIPCSSFGNTRKNPFFKIMAIALDKNNPSEDRIQAVRFMDHIPHVNKVASTVKAAISIIDDESIPIGERYFFMSNNEKISKLSDHIVRECHLHFFEVAGTRRYPLILHLTSAQVIYTTLIHSEPIWTEAREFILKLAQDENESVRIRAEAADILCRKISKDDAAIGLAVISSLGNLYIENKMTSIYTNAQNAHNESITESVMQAIRTLVAKRSLKRDKARDASPEGDIGSSTTFSGDAQQVKDEQNSGDIYERIVQLSRNLDKEHREKIMSSFNLILIYPAKYEGITLSDVMTLVWNKMYEQTIEVKLELEKRMVQELFEMESTCGTGLLSRLINVLSGYVDEEGLQIKMSIKDQLRANIFGRLQTNMRLIPEGLAAEIFNEIADDKSEKETVRKFIQTYEVKTELQTEFVEAKLINQDEFDKIYNKSIADFIGSDQLEQF
jgi:hypothetical protein